ncbi:MAG: epimerase [Polyangiaceae bacterium]|nr:epimerase [Polyangiaceae bacterium]
MRVILFGATGMVGQGALRECLLAGDVEHVLCVGRRPTGQTHPKLEDLVLSDLYDFGPVADRLAEYDACFFCLGVTSVGMSEADYRRVTRDIAAAAARVLVQRNPGMTFIIVTGRGTDSTGTSATMWARVKGEAENAIFELPFKGKYAFRPGIIQPLHGIHSRTLAYRALYTALGWLFPVIRAFFPGAVTTTERVGQAMLNVAQRGYPHRILEGPDINRAAVST